MKTKKIYLVRHGQTDYNKAGIVQGSGVDAPLNQLGHNQAEAFHTAYKHIPFDKVYTSALQRSIQSVKLFLDMSLPHQVLPELNEISWGDREGMKITPEEDQYYHWVLKQWQEGNTSLALEGGESPEEVAERQKKAIAHIISQQDEENILICMHGRAMRILLCTLLNYPLKSMDNFEHTNLCLYQLSYTGSMFVIDQFDERTHLNGFLS
ncbi:MAG: histidine phosphatase family protein [Bacteroidota bacterium]